MRDHRDDVPAYLTVRLTVPDASDAALADTTAWQAREVYPQVRFAGGPVFGVARERPEGGWELHPYFGAQAPQDARDSMGSHFRRLAQHAEQDGDRAGHEECLRAAWRMDAEAIEEMAVLGSPTPQGARDSLALYLRVTAPWTLGLDPRDRAGYAAAADRLDERRADDLAVGERQFRVVRVERLMRIGPDGPEGPRPSDPDPQLPVLVHARQLRGPGSTGDGKEGEDAPIKLDDDARRFLQLFHEEEERRARHEGR